ncbi:MULTISPECIES: hypothetical protein [unclassified Anoxybacillus]|uniref:hypothetical protein n=1 Tax=unclassified Anoxybacillus TaxID=2639704 RepID=UPI00082C4020|nr:MULTISPECIES: hypothetical protein [unclassified Anoxybacillus]
MYLLIFCFLSIGITLTTVSIYKVIQEIKREESRIGKLQTFLLIIFDIFIENPISGTAIAFLFGMASLAAGLIFLLLVMFDMAV